MSGNAFITVVMNVNMLSAFYIHNYNKFEDKLSVSRKPGLLEIRDSAYISAKPEIPC